MPFLHLGEHWHYGYRVAVVNVTQFTNLMQCSHPQAGNYCDGNGCVVNER